MSNFFLQPALVWGAALAVIPLIIHLLYRRRFRTVEWAPMRYLKLTVQHNRRRIRLEQLLLLLARMCIIVLLFGTVARPMMRGTSWATWLGGSSRTSQILVLDDSLSMGYQHDGRSAFARAREVAEQLTSSIGSKDRFTLVLTSRPKSPLLREVEIGDRKQVADLLRTLKSSDTFTSWPTTCESIEELVTAGTFPIRQVSIVTDLRRAGWDKPLSELGSRWSRQRVRLRIFDVGQDATKNLSLDALEQTERLALVGTPVQWNAVVSNRSDEAHAAFDAEFIVDGKPTLVRMPAIPAAGNRTVSLSATLQEAGQHRVSLKLPADALGGDNQRWSIVSVRESVQFVLVDGEPSSEPLGGEADFLALALSIGEAEGSAYQIELVTDAELSTVLANPPDLIALAGVSRLNPADAAQLARAVRSGTGLMIFTGEQIDPDNYNQLLYGGRTPLLPFALQGVADQEVRGLLVEDEPASPLRPMLQLKPAVLERIGTRKYFELDTAKIAAGVRVLARWNNAPGSPAIAERVAGRGRVLLWATTADKGWTAWPTEPSYVLAVREAAKAIARSDADSAAFTAGEPLRYLLAANESVRTPEIETPGSSRSQPLIAEEASDTKAPQGAQKLLNFSDTHLAGLYKMSWKGAPGPGSHRWFAVNPNQRESDLARITSDQVRKLWAPLDFELVRAGGSASDGAGDGRELWRSLAIGLLGLVAFEACFASWVGRQR